VTQADDRVERDPHHDQDEVEREHHAHGHNASVGVSITDKVSPRAPLEKPAALLVAAVLALLAGGCGSAPLTADSLQKSADTVHSVAAEGELLARDAADGRTLATFRSAHATALGETVAKEATTLRAAQGEGVLRQRADALAGVADDVAGLLGELGDADGARAGGLADELDRAADRARELGEPR
jgi:hypothetical protein